MAMKVSDDEINALVAKLPLAPDLAAQLVRALANINCRATIELDLSGAEGGRVALQVDEGVRVADNPETVDVILRAQRSRLEAILRGSASVADSLIADRLSLSGDFAKIVVFKRALETAAHKRSGSSS
jgi:hypothetical protein